MVRRTRPSENARMLPFPVDEDRINDRRIGQRKIEGADRRLPLPPITDLLLIDKEYRRKARLGRLVQIAPSPFNRDRKTWLPILRTYRNGYRYTAMFSKTPVADELGMTRDWVTIYRQGDERQWTVVTGQCGSTAGRRIVRDYEAECEAHFARLTKTE